MSPWRRCVARGAPGRGVTSGHTRSSTSPSKQSARTCPTCDGPAYYATTRVVLLTTALLTAPLLMLAMRLASVPHASYAPHLRVLPHAARARDGGGARAGGSVSSQRDARVIEQPPGGGDNQLPGGAARGHAGGGMGAWVHGCMHMLMGHQHLCGVVPDLALRCHLILLCPMPTH